MHVQSHPCEMTWTRRSGWTGYYQSVVIVILAFLIELYSPGLGLGAESHDQTERKSPQTKVLHLSLEEAVSLFLHQNLDVLVAKYGIDVARAEQVTAGLFPNPELALELKSAFTQGCQLSDCGQVAPHISQLFEIAGKRGFRIESTAYATQAAEAVFEDVLRQLQFTVRDTYYQVQITRKRLALDQEVLKRFYRVLEQEKEGSLRKVAKIDIMRIHLQAVSIQAEVIQDAQEMEEATSVLRVLLGVLPDTNFKLMTKPRYQPIKLDVLTLRPLALKTRPDIRAKRLIRSQRQAELKLARALQFPDVTVGLGYNIQGPMGSDNQQQWNVDFGIPLPIFDRNQGNLQKAQAGARRAELEFQKASNQVQNQVDLAFRHFMQSSRLVGTYLDGALEKSLSVLTLAEDAYTNQNMPLLEFLDAARVVNDLREKYFEALYQYQHNLLILESAVGEELTKGI